MTIYSRESILLCFGKSLLAGAALVLALAVAQAQSTNIAIGSNVWQPSVKRLGINLSIENYYDSGQMNKGLVFRNPGFEGEIYQSTVRCASGTATTCVDENGYSNWPKGFWNGATVEFFYGAAQGRSETVTSYSAANGSVGGTFTFSGSGTAPGAGDYMIVRMTVPGNATAGWWPTTTGAGTITTNVADLPPGTGGRQTVAIQATGAGDNAALAAYFDGTPGRSFVTLNGAFQLTFKAKASGGSNAVAVSLERYGVASYLNQTVQLTDSWATYRLTFNAAENGTQVGSVGLTFKTVGQDSFLLDDVSLTQTNTDPANPTAFRDPVVNALKSLNPGVLRFWAGQLGDTLDNLLAAPYARQRAGYSAFATEQDDISYGLPEFLQLCETLGAEPWIVVPSTFSTAEAAHLIEYLAGSASTVYGGQRAAWGHPTPWISAFAKIHLEFGNEAWNSTFKGGTIEYSAPYGQRAQAIFAAMRGDGAYVASAFDLVLGGQAAWAARNQDIQNNCNNNDTFAVAPYMMNTVDSFSTNENLFGSTFAEPEAFLSPNGVAEGVSGGLMSLNQQAIQSSHHPVPVALYEMNLSTVGGSITQAALNSYASSLGAGLAVADSMLQQMRAGILTQNLFALPQYQFLRPDGSTVFLWGSVIDMGVTDRRRPQFLALQLINQAIGNNASMLQTTHSGANPVWDQPLANTVQLNGAHYLQSFAFANGSQRSLVLFNLHRSSALPVTFSGPNAPSGSVQLQQLSATNPTDNNETASVVSPSSNTVANFSPSSTISLPPNSMTTLSWVGGSFTPSAPVITGITTSAVSGTSATITWTTDQAASSQVAYGTTEAYSSQSTVDPTLLTSHSVTLSALSPGTLYNFAVISTASGSTTTSTNFTFSTSTGVAIAFLGGASSNTGNNPAPSSLSIKYASGDRNTIVAVCALGSVSSSIGSITDSGSTWALRGYVNNGSAVRSEIWSTPAGGSVASTSFTINLAGATPASCALEEYSGVRSLGNVAANQGTSNSLSVTLTTQDPNNYVVGGLGANSWNSYAPNSGTLRQTGGPTNSGIEMALCDNTAATAGPVPCSVNFGTSPWAAVALELRSVGASPASLPAVNSVASTVVTATGATIAWATDQASSTQVAYGTTAAYGSLSVLNSSLVTSHVVTLAGLTPGTIYNYQVISANSAGTTTSANFTFSTPAAPPAISNVLVSAITGTSATITWTTDQPSNAQVQFGITAVYGSLSAIDSSMRTSHSVTLTGLNPGTAYNFAAVSANSAGLSSASPNASFATASGGPAPQIQNLASWGISGNSITIAWWTDQPSTASVQFGTTPAFGQSSPLPAGLSQNYQVTLSGLSDGTTYYFRVQATSGSNVTGHSATYSFTTLSTLPPLISSIQVTPSANHTAVVTWSQSKAGSGQVEFGTNIYYGLWSSPSALVLNPQIALTWVPSGTIHYRVHSTDAAGNQSVSSDYTFTEP